MYIYIGSVGANNSLTPAISKRTATKKDEEKEHNHHTQYSESTENNGEKNEGTYLDGLMPLLTLNNSDKFDVFAQQMILRSPKVEGLKILLVSDDGRNAFTNYLKTE